MRRRIGVSELAAIVLLCSGAVAAAFTGQAADLVVQAEKSAVAGRYEQALQQYTEALKVETDAESKLELEIRLARTYVYMNQVGRARFALTKLSRETGNAKALLEAARAYLYYHPYRVALARTYLDRILGKEPRHVEALIEMGFCDLNTNDLGKARTTFEKALSIDRTAIKGYYGLAKIHFIEKDFTRAVDRLRAALALGPENAETMFMLGQVYQGSNEPQAREASMTWLSRASEQEPTNVKYLAAGVFAALCRQHPADAEIFRKRIAALDPQNGYVVWTEGVYLELQGKVVQAQDKYAEALNKDWLNLYAHFSLGNIRTGYGNPEYIMNAELETWRYTRFKNSKAALENFEMIASSPDVFPYLHAVRQRLRVLYEEPGAPDWSAPGFVKKLEAMRDYGKLFNPY